MVVSHNCTTRAIYASNTQADVPTETKIVYLPMTNTLVKLPVAKLNNVRIPTFKLVNTIIDFDLILSAYMKHFLAITYEFIRIVLFASTIVMYFVNLILINSA